MRLIVFCLSLSFVFALAIDCEAQTPNFMSELGPNSIMSAGAYATGGRDMDAFRGNPALLVLRRGQSGFGGGWQDLPENASSWQLAILDGTRDLVSGAHFQWWDQGNLDRKSYSLGGAYRTPYGAAGVSTSLMQFTGGFDEGNGWHLTTSTGILTPAFGGMTLGVSLKNLVDRANNKVLPPELAMGLNFSRPGRFNIHLQSDRRFSIDGQKWNYSVAGETILREFFALKGGYRFDRSDGPSYWSIGLSILAPRVDLAGYFIRTAESNASNGFGFHCLFLF